MGADAVNVADSPMARVRMGALALCTQIQQQVDIETILHFTTRDRSLMALAGRSDRRARPGSAQYPGPDGRSAQPGRQP